MAENIIFSRVTYSSTHVSNAPAGEVAHESNILIKETLGTSPVQNNPNCSPSRMSPSLSPSRCGDISFESITDAENNVTPLSNNIINSSEIISTADVFDDLTNSYLTIYQSDVTVDSTLCPHFQELDFFSSRSDKSDIISNRDNLSTLSTNHHNYHLICNCSLGKADHQGGMEGKCEICRGSMEKKVCLQQDMQLCEQFLDSLSRLEDWLQITQIAASLLNPSRTLHKEAKLALRKYEGLLKDIREKLLDLESLNRQYWRITQIPHQMLLPTTLRSRMQEVNQFWDHLQKEAETICQNLKSKVQQRDEFETDQDDLKLCLTEMDMELSSVEYIYNGNSTEKIQQLKAFQEDVWNNMKRVEGLLERGDELIYESHPQDAMALEEEMTELGSYCQEIFIRLSRLQKRLVSTKLVFEDDVLDSGFEHVSSGSSDVFLDLDFEDEEVPGLSALPPAKAAFAFDLEWDPMGDVGSSGSRDGQDLFYTPRSTPRKALRRNKCSASSVSTDSGVTNSKHRSQEDLLPVDEDLPAFIVPRGTVISAGFRRPRINIQVQTVDSKVLCNGLPPLEAGQSEVASSCGLPPIDTLDSGPTTDEPKYDSNVSHPEVPVESNNQESHMQHNISEQRRRQGKKKKMTRTQEIKRKEHHHHPARQDVSILMDNGDSTTQLKSFNSSYGRSGSLWFSIKCLTFLSFVFLLLCGSLLLFPLSHTRCSSQRFSWTLMLTYVNGPPPT